MDQIEQMLNAFQQNSMSPVSSPRQLLSSPPQQPNTVHVTRRTSAPGNLPEWQSTLNAQQQVPPLPLLHLEVSIGKYATAVLVMLSGLCDSHTQPGVAICC